MTPFSRHKIARTMMLTTAPLTTASTMAFLGTVALLISVEGFAPVSLNRRRPSPLRAAPKRLEENVDGVLYVNDKCINCSACSHFAPNVFERSRTDRYHVVYHQPDSPLEVDHARAALAACPVAAIRVESQAQRSHNKQQDLTDDEKELATSLALSPKLNNLKLPFPRPTTMPDVYFVGHHNEASFGATPYLTQVEVNGSLVWIMVDSPKYSKLSRDAVTSLTGPDGPDYLFLTHVDDVAGHQDWKREFPSLKRIFHSGDLGKNNWIGDKTLEDVEILLPDVDGDISDDGLNMYSVDGIVLKSLEDTQDDVVILHTPGHSPGSISLYQRPTSPARPGVLFTGDTYGYTTRTNQMTGFHQYGNNLQKQAQVLQQLLAYDWDVILPGHGHMKDYSHVENKQEEKRNDVQAAISQMKLSYKW